MSFPTEKQLRDRFDRSEHAVYFATADKRTRYYGFGVREEKFGADFQEVAPCMQHGHVNNVTQSLVAFHSMNNPLRIAH